MPYEDFSGKEQPAAEGKAGGGDASAGTHVVVKVRRKCGSELERLLLAM